MHARYQILVLQSVLCILSWTARLFLYSVLLTACRGDEVVYPTIGTHVTDEVREGGLYVLCEGNMGANKARLDYINLRTGDCYSNWYGAMNPKQMKELGDVGNDIQQYGGRLYAVINCSHKVEVMDLQARRIGQVDIPNCRYIAFHNDKAYVSAYVGSVADADLLGAVYEIDTATLAITREVQVGHQPDELCIIGNMLYVANSGGYLTNRYDSTLSVIDLNTFTEIEKINVGLNPTRVRADKQGHLWVCCQGNYNDRQPEIVIVGGPRIATSCANISIQGNVAYVLDNEHKELKAYSTIDYSLSSFRLSLPAYENPYGLLATEDVIYITDAKNYVSSGVLHCYTYDGREHWKAYTGDIPGHLCRIAGEYDLAPEPTPEPEQKNPYIHVVYEYLPGMGQFVNELPAYEAGDDAASMCRKCEKSLVNNARGTVSLGGWGGYITFGFDHAVENLEGRDIQILGNAFYMSGSTEYGSSEPGIVLVSRDENGNGLPDDTWFELKGCLYDDPTTVHSFARTYTRESDTGHNPFHDHPYYPQWLTADEYTLHGAKLAPQTVTVRGQYVQRILDYGYADNKPNTDIEGSSFDISWAIDADGHPVSLPTIDFVRVYNASDEVLDQTGELSTEITGAIDLHINN